MINLTHHEDSHFCVRWLTGAGTALFVSVEDPTTAASPQLRDLVEQASTQQSSSVGAPAAVAVAIDRALKAARDEALPRWVFYSAVLVAPDRVECCVAGPHRVHLVRSGALIASSREHVLRHDQPPPDWPASARDAIDMELQGNVVTRSLGASVSLPAETTVWNTTLPYRVVLCSADAHRERAPNSYATTLQVGSNLAAWSGGAGAVAAIEYS